MINETYLLWATLAACAAVTIWGIGAAKKYHRLAVADVLVSSLKKCLLALDAAKAVRMCDVASAEGASGALRYRRIILTINRSPKATYQEEAVCKRELSAEFRRYDRADFRYFIGALLAVAAANAVVNLRLAPEWITELLCGVSLVLAATLLRYLACEKLRHHGEIEDDGLTVIAVMVAEMTEANRKQAGVNHMVAD